MKNFIAALSFYFLLGIHPLYAALSSNEIAPKPTKKSYEQQQRLLVAGYVRKYDIPNDVIFCIIQFKYNVQYNKIFSGDDIAGENLSNLDLSQHQFKNTDLGDTNLDGVILTDTICDYQLPYLKSIDEITKKFTLSLLPSILLNISRKIYPKMLQKDTDKARLLSIASGLYCSTKYYGKATPERSITIIYWYCSYLDFCQSLEIKDIDGGIFYAMAYSKQLQKCWVRNKKNKNLITQVDEHSLPTADFDRYLREFSTKLEQYCDGEPRNRAIGMTHTIEENLPIQDNYYVKEIKKCIKKLKEAYAMIKSKELKEEADIIAHGLSKTYRFEKLPFLCNYFYLQLKLVKLKQKVESNVKKYIYYNTPIHTNLF